MPAKSRSQGQLEQAVLNVLWDAHGSENAHLTSHQILEALGGTVALTTVLTVLSRLGAKGLVAKANGDGRSLLFTSTSSREEHNAKAMIGLIQASSNPALAFSHFAKNLSAKDLQTLRELINQSPK